MTAITLMDLNIPAFSERRFFTMGELSGMVQVPSYTIRYWESRMGGFLRPSRRSSGHRRYTRSDMETICMVRDLVRKRKMTLDGAKRALMERKKSGIRRIAGPQDELPFDDRKADPAGAKILQDIRKEIQSLVAELSS
ncbi:MAG: MerR family transcriptional regulator [Elusimicrobiota bacterium]